LSSKTEQPRPSFRDMSSNSRMTPKGLFRESQHAYKEAGNIILPFAEATRMKHLEVEATRRKMSLDFVNDQNVPTIHQLVLASRVT
ncbi:hypothetical protein Tco_1350222, partial [Tanacetum coccineum]